MDNAEFDKFAAEYREMHAANIGASGEAPDYFAEYKVRDIASLVTVAGSKPYRILDFGAGVGTSVPYLRKYFPRAALTCLDVSQKSLDIGQSRFPNDAEFQIFDGRIVPLADNSVDLVFVACVFHHIPPGEHSALLSELRRVITPGGALFLYEHNPYNPLTVRAVNTCPLDENAILIRPGNMLRNFKSAGFRVAQVRYRVFFPRLLSKLRFLEKYLQWCPVGAQYSVLATK